MVQRMALCSAELMGLLMVIQMEHLKVKSMAIQMAVGWVF